METKTMREMLDARRRDLTTNVSAVTGMSEDAINIMMFERGAEYIESLAEGLIADVFKREPLYWSWWRQQWAIIDEVYLQQIPAGMTQQTKVAIYRDMHENIDAYPDPIIWDQIHKSYGKMAGKIIEKQRS